jgi:hypothetical protein
MIRRRAGRKSMTRSRGFGWKAFGLVAALPLLIASAAMSEPSARPEGGEGATAAPGEPEWEVILSSYFWATALEGEVGADGATTDVDMSASDVLDQVNIGLTGVLEARRNRWIFLFDANWSELEDDIEEGPETLSFGPTTTTQTVRGPLGVPRELQVRVPRVDVSVGPVEVNTTSTTLILDGKLGYRVLSRSFGELHGGEPEDDPRRLAVDLFLGARYMRLTTELDIEIPPIQVPGFNLSPSLPAFPNLKLPDVEVPGVTLAGFDDDFEETIDWVDLNVGLRARVDLTDRISLGLRGDVGGFGIGSASDFTWQAMGLVNYRLGDHWILSGGYRALGYDRDPYDLVQHGLILGASYRF